MQEKFAYAGKTWRWFGHSDTVTLSDLKQMGVKGVVTSLHHLKPGEVWDTWAFGEISQLIENKGLRWSAVESLPVSEAIKKGDELAEIHIQNYIESLHNLAANGVDRVCYNFMPVIDWVSPTVTLTEARRCSMTLLPLHCLISSFYKERMRPRIILQRFCKPQLPGLPGWAIRKPICSSTT